MNVKKVELKTPLFFMKTDAEQKKKAEQQAQQRATTNKANWIMPCYGKIVGAYGEPRPTHIHDGIDIAVPIGTPIKAIADGVVCAVGKADGYGYWVAIDHGMINGKRVTSEYGHISRWNVSLYQRVKQGNTIAYSGNTGHSKGPHLHVTLRHGDFQGRAVNPWDYISR